MAAAKMMNRPLREAAASITPPFLRKLGAKINAILVLFFLFAVSVILLTLYAARQLEGEGAAINVAGSQRMLIHVLANRMHQMLGNTRPREEVRKEAEDLAGQIDQALRTLEAGDPERPLFLPREPQVREQMRLLEREWREDLRPRVGRVLGEAAEDERRRLLAGFDERVSRHVGNWDALVLMIERSNARNTFLMFLFQNVLVAFALLGTLLLIYLFRKLVIEPVEMLRAGIERMATSDFDVRLPVLSRDEFGELAAGFNHMAANLRELYATLEQRVAEKTRSVEERNRELALLYEIAAFLGEQTTLEAVCDGVLTKLRGLLGARSGAVRLVDPATATLKIVISHDLPESFCADEANLPLGACLCGQAAAEGRPIDLTLGRPLPAGMSLECCARHGFAAMAAIPISSKSQVIGVLNLFFDEPRPLSSHETRLLEAIGQHLGVAVESLRLVMREKEMAVSEERNLLAQELHDSIAQSLAFLNIQAQMLEDSLRAGQAGEAREELARMREGIQESYDDVRELLVHFRIRMDHAGLEEAIRSALQKFEGQTGVRTAFIEEGGAVPPPATGLVQILHILQEALSNVRKHARAGSVTVRLGGGQGELILSVCDDGIGFDPARMGGNGGACVGIDIMRERAHRIGARLEVDSAPGRGSCVTLALPG